MDTSIHKIKYPTANFKKQLLKMDTSIGVPTAL